MERPYRNPFTQELVDSTVMGRAGIDEMVDALNYMARILTTHSQELEQRVRPYLLPISWLSNTGAVSGCYPAKHDAARRGYPVSTG